ncbi:hypothetical protein AMTRI_Chr04g180850 [Amborella trichopoda]
MGLKFKVVPGVVELLMALAYAQQFFVFHLHSIDHAGLEGQYHLLLQIAILMDILMIPVTTLLSIPHPKSFLVGLVRPFGLLLQGLWFMGIGYMLWTPILIPKGCEMSLEEEHMVVRCNGHEEQSRVKSLVNLQFSFLVAGLAIFTVLFYVGMLEKYVKNEYVGPGQEEELPDFPCKSTKYAFP